MPDEPVLAPGTLLGIAGSPRRDGNSERFLDACLTGAREAGEALQRAATLDAANDQIRRLLAASHKRRDR